MKRIGKNEEVNDTWIKKWEDTYTECSDASLPEVSGDRPLYDFLQAIYAVDESWSTAQGIAFEQMLSMDSKLPTLYVLLERYRNHRRLINASKPRADTNHNHSAFASTAFQFRDQDGNWQLPCVCGVKHQYVDCPYLNEAIQTPGWQKNDETATKVANALRKFKVKQQVDKQFANWKKEQEEKAKSNPNSSDLNATEPQKKGSWATAIRSSFTGSMEDSFIGSTDDFLQDCALLDSACSDHVINHRRKERFIKTRSAGPEDILYAGKDQYQIEAFGKSWIEVMTPTGKERQDLENVAYVSGFLTNCISLSQLKKKNVHFDSQFDRLHCNGKTLVSLQLSHGYWMLEHNVPPTAFASKRSTALVQTTKTAARWHDVLAHASYKVKGQSPPPHSTPPPPSMLSLQPTPPPQSMPPLQSTLSPQSMMSHQLTALLSPLPEIHVQPQLEHGSNNVESEDLVVPSSFHLEGGQPSRSGSEFSEAAIIPAYAMHQTITSSQPLYAAFSARRAIPKIYRDSLPTTLRNWKEMLSHPYAKESKVDAQKEHDDLLCNNQQTLRLLNQEISKLVPKLHHVDVH
jgi:hypothetical protein